MLLEDGPPAGTPDRPEASWPTDAEVCWHAGLVLLVGTASMFLVAGWAAAG